VARLKKEKIDYEFNISEWGKKDGLEWCRPPISENFSTPSLGPYINPDRDEELGDYFSHMFKKYKNRVTGNW